MTNPSKEEREKIVAWLRMVSEGLITAQQAIAWRPEKLAEMESAADAYARAADAIEQLAHHKGSST